MALELGVKPARMPPGGFTPAQLHRAAQGRPLQQMLEWLRAAALELAIDRVGNGALLAARVHLKGSLATAAMEQKSLVDLVVDGADLDLQLDANDLVEATASDKQRTEFAKRVAVLWVCSLLEGEPPRVVKQRMEQNVRWSLPGQVFLHFFSARKAITPTGEQSAQQDCWGLYGLDLILPDGRERKLDLTVAFRLERPFLSDDAAFQISLPLHGSASESTCWVSPQVAMRSVAEGSFSVPNLDQVKRGALEKVLSRMARGAVYRSESPDQAPARLVEHFIESCRQEDPHEWQRAAKRRLSALPQPHWTKAQRWALVVQLVQIFPDWEREWALSLCPQQELPQEAAALSWILHEMEGVQRARALGALLPLLSGALQVHGWPPLPVWYEEGERFLEDWFALPAQHPFRQAVGHLARSPARGESCRALLEQWISRLLESPAPGMDARLILRLLATCPPAGDLPQLECWAGRCLLEIGDTRLAAELVTPWPVLVPKCGVLESLLSQRGLTHLAKVPAQQRRELWLEALQRWRHLARAFAQWPHGLLSPAGRQKALWGALLQCLQVRGEFLPALVEEALTLGPPSQEQADQTVWRVLLPMALEEGQSLEHLQAISLLLARAQTLSLAHVEPSTITREMRAWMRILDTQEQYGLQMAPECLRAIWEGIQAQRWGQIGTSALGTLFERHLSRYQPSLEDAEKLLEWAEQQPTFRKWVPESLLPALSHNAARRWIEQVWREKPCLTAIEQQVLERWLANEQVGPAFRSLGYALGWPLDDRSLWQQTVQLIVELPSERLMDASMRLLAAARSQMPDPGEPITQQLCRWIEREGAGWVPMAGSSQSAAIALVEAAQIWAKRWRRPQLAQTLLAGWWRKIEQDLSQQRLQLSDALIQPIEPAEWCALIGMASLDGWMLCSAEHGGWLPLLHWMANRQPSELIGLLLSEHPWSAALSRASRAEQALLAEALTLFCEGLSAADLGKLSRALGAGQAQPAASASLAWVVALEGLIRRSADRRLQQSLWQQLVQVLGGPDRAEVPAALLQRARSDGIACWIQELERVLSLRPEEALPQAVVEEQIPADAPLGFLSQVARISDELSARREPLDLTPEQIAKLNPMLALLLGPDLAILGEWQGIIRWENQSLVQQCLTAIRSMQPGLLAHMMLVRLQEQLDRPLTEQNGRELDGLMSAGIPLEQFLKAEPQVQKTLLARAMIGALTVRLAVTQTLTVPLWSSAATWSSFIKDLSDPDVQRLLLCIQSTALQRLLNWAGAQSEQPGQAIPLEEEEGVLNALEMVGALSGFLSGQARFREVRLENLKLAQRVFEKLPPSDLKNEAQRLRDGLASVSWDLFVEQVPEDDQVALLLDATRRAIEDSEAVPEGFCHAILRGLLPCAAAECWRAHPAWGAVLLLGSGLAAALETDRTLPQLLAAHQLSANDLFKAMQQIDHFEDPISLFGILSMRRVTGWGQAGPSRVAWLEGELSQELLPLDDWLQRIAKAHVALQGVQGWVEALANEFEVVEGSGPELSLLDGAILRSFLLTGIYLETECGKRWEKHPLELRKLREATLHTQERFLSFARGPLPEVPFLIFGCVGVLSDRIFHLATVPAGSEAVLLLGIDRLRVFLENCLLIERPSVSLMMMHYFLIQKEFPAPGILARHWNDLLRMSQRFEAQTLAGFKALFGNIVRDLAGGGPLEKSRLERIALEIRPLGAQVMQTEAVLPVLITAIEGLRQIELLRPHTVSASFVHWMNMVERELMAMVKRQGPTAAGRAAILKLSEVALPGVVGALQQWVAEARAQYRQRVPAEWLLFFRQFAQLSERTTEKLLEVRRARQAQR